mmetsp:Transcript_41074/g.66768  ORF Transcript_41074/g.66768 Transcript_41074/m.66768 type:complete len:639 (-) Transcript_41074:211-2127(-)
MLSTDVSLYFERYLNLEKLEHMINMCFTMMARLTSCNLQTTNGFMSKVARMVFRSVMNSRKGIRDTTGVGLDEFTEFCKRNQSATAFMCKFGTTDGKAIQKNQEQRYSTIPSIFTGDIPTLTSNKTIEYMAKGKALDENVYELGQGRLSVAKVYGVKQVFDVLDGDKSGEIELSELEESFSQNKILGTSSSPIFRNIDLNIDGKVSFYELLRVLYPRERRKELKRLSQLMITEKFTAKDLTKCHKLFCSIAAEDHFEKVICFGDFQCKMPFDNHESVKEAIHRFEALLDFQPDQPALLKFQGETLDMSAKIGAGGVAESADALDYVVPETKDSLEHELLTPTLSVVRAVSNSNLHRVKVLLKNERIRKRRVMARDRRGRTLLHYACEEGSVDIIRVLAEYKADINAESKSRTTPLHICCKRNNKFCISLLLELGANDELVDQNDNQPYDYLTDIKLKKMFQGVPETGASPVSLVRLKPMLYCQKMLNFRVATNRIIEGMQEDPDLKKYTRHYSVQQRAKDETRLGFLEFITQVFKLVYDYKELEVLLQNHLKSRILTKAQTHECFKFIAETDDASNYFDLRNFLKLHYLPDDINNIIEWYENSEKESMDEHSFRHGANDYWTSLPAELLKHAGMKRNE